MTARCPLLVQIELAATCGAEQVSVRSSGTDVVIEFSGVVSAFRIVRQLGSFRAIRRLMIGLSEFLSHIGLTVVLRTPKRTLLSLGTRTSPLLTRLIGIPNAVRPLR